VAEATRNIGEFLSVVRFSEEFSIIIYLFLHSTIIQLQFLQATLTQIYPALNGFGSYLFGLRFVLLFPPIHAQIYLLLSETPDNILS